MPQAESLAGQQGQVLQSNNHFVVETPDANLSKGMRQLNGVYTQQFNRRHVLVDHLFQGRFEAILVERDAYLLELSRYVVLNPVRAAVVPEASAWPWSSYRAMMGLISASAWLETDWMLGQFGGDRHTAQARYAAFVVEGMGQPGISQALRHQVFPQPRWDVSHHRGGAGLPCRMRPYRFTSAGCSDAFYLLTFIHRVAPQKQNGASKENLAGAGRSCNHGSCRTRLGGRASMRTQTPQGVGEQPAEYMRQRGSAGELCGWYGVYDGGSRTHQGMHLRNAACACPESCQLLVAVEDLRSASRTR